MQVGIPFVTYGSHKQKAMGCTSDYNTKIYYV